MPRKHLSSDGRLAVRMMWILHPLFEIHDLAELYAVSGPTVRRLTKGLERGMQAGDFPGYVEVRRRWEGETGESSILAFHAALDRALIIQMKPFDLMLKKLRQIRAGWALIAGGSKSPAAVACP